MSYQEAIADNIPHDRGQNGFSRYYPPCQICGTPVYSWGYVRGAKYTCPECRLTLASLAYAKKSKLSADRQTQRLDQAVKRIGHVTKIAPYADAVSYVQENMDKPGWFQSTEEIMVALELFRHNIVTQHQLRVFEYSVDFFLPDLKVALEIDGSIFHGKEREWREKIRDEVIADKLDCEVIRISTDNINKNITRLLPAIETVLRKRKGPNFPVKL